MDERNSRDHVIQLYNAQKTKRDKFEKDIATAKTDKEKANAKAHIEVATKAMDDIIVNENPKVSKAAQVDEATKQQQEPVFKHSETSHEATSKERDAPDAMIAYSINSGPTPINYAPPNVVTINQVQDMIGQAMDTIAK
ncbi:hypothetical protein JHK85_040888 [Glycine max]|nr:hypothetical protein JHK86_040304 [Glycine max]KAG4965913.1 hypothetical protein JHK85_040888 [Glycine max]